MYPMDRQLLDDGQDSQNSRQYELYENRPSSSGYSTAAGVQHTTLAASTPPTPPSASSQYAISPTYFQPPCPPVSYTHPPPAYPQRPTFGQHSSTSHVALSHLIRSSSPVASSSRPVSAPNIHSYARETEQSQQRESPRTEGGGDGTNSSASGLRKNNVASACLPCKRAHLGCDNCRPCRRCVNMGKEMLCEDVPHKKRGRPKQSRAPLTEPYSRVPRPSTTGDYHASIGSHRYRESLSSIPYSAGMLTDFGPNTATGPATLTSSPIRPLSSPLPSYPSPQQLLTVASPPSATRANLFELFTTIDMRIIRTTPAVHDLTGYHPYEMLNLSLGDFLDSTNGEIMNLARGQLLPRELWNASTKRETILAVNDLSPVEVLSPAVGMLEPYPNQNFRFRKANGEHALYNIRLHLGGGLGADMTRPETLERLYIVVSLLLLEDCPTSDRPVSTQGGPLTPLSPIHPPFSHVTSSVSTSTSPISPGGISSLLPSFSALAAGVQPGRASTQYPQHYSPLRTSLSNPLSPRQSPTSAFRWSAPAQSVAGQVIDLTSPVKASFGDVHSSIPHAPYQTQSQYTHHVQPPHLPSLAHSPRPSTGLTLAPFGSARSHGLDRPSTSSGGGLGGPSDQYTAPTMPYPQYPPRDPEQPSSPLDARPTTSSGWSDTSRRTWEL